MYSFVVLCIVCFVTFPVLFVCICVLNNCHRVATQLQLTLRLLMSYIHMQRLFLMFLYHTQRRTTVGRTPLDE